MLNVQIVRRVPFVMDPSYFMSASFKENLLLCVPEHAYLEGFLLVCSNGSAVSLHFRHHLFCWVSPLQLTSNGLLVLRCLEKFKTHTKLNLQL